MSKIGVLYVARVEYSAEHSEHSEHSEQSSAQINIPRPWYALIDYDIVSVSTRKVSHGPESGWEKVAIDFECKSGDLVYVLVLRYTQGDSFGESKGNTEILGIFKDKQFANETAQVLNTKLRDKNNKTIEFSTETGIEVSTPDFTKEYFCAYEKIEVVEKKVSL